MGGPRASAFLSLQGADPGVAAGSSPFYHTGSYGSFSINFEKEEEGRRRKKKILRKKKEGEEEEEEGRRGGRRKKKKKKVPLALDPVAPPLSLSTGTDFSLSPPPTLLAL
jgi:hypothetical protein